MSDLPDPNMAQKMSYEDVQRFIRETDQKRSHLSFFNQQAELINHSVLDLEGSKKSIQEIQNRNAGETILLPLGSHLLIEAKLQSRDKVLFDLRSLILQEIDFKTAKAKIKNRLEELNKTQDILSSNISRLRSEILSRDNFLNQLVPLNK